MKNTKTWIYATAITLLSGILLLGGCATNVNPTTPQQPQPPYTLPPTGQPAQPADVKITYNYDDTSKVKLSNNNITLKVGQRLIIEPAPGLTKMTRFTSSGENFFGDIMKQEGDAQARGKAVFTAIKQGKGRLQIIPNTNDLDQATDLWVTVQ